MTDKNNNTGNYNTGNSNTGNSNTGNYNTGNYNTGNANTGNYNTGYYNTGNRNTGAFNRDTPKMRLFEKELDMTVLEFYEQYNIHADLPLCQWIDKADMTAQERKDVPSCETTGGYLKILDYKEAWKIWWEENPDDHDRFLNLPGFDAQIFLDITGVDVRESVKPKTINIGGTTYEVTPELTKALAGLKEAK